MKTQVSKIKNLNQIHAGRKLTPTVYGRSVSSFLLNKE